LFKKLRSLDFDKHASKDVLQCLLMLVGQQEGHAPCKISLQQFIKAYFWVLVWPGMTLKN